MWILLLVAGLAGVLETAIVQRWYDVRPIVVRWTGNTAELAGMDDEPEVWTAWSTLLVIAANLASSLIAYVALANNSEFRQWVLGSKPLEHVGLYFTSMWMISLLISVVVEWPLFSIAIKDRPLSREGLGVCLGANIVTGACGIILLSLAGLTPSRPPVETTPPSTIARGPLATVYFVDPSTRHVMRVRTDGLLLQNAGISLDPSDELSIETAPNGHAKLYAVGEGLKPLKDFGPYFDAALMDPALRDTWLRDARYFRDDDRKRYEVHYGPDPDDGLSVMQPNRIYKLSIDMGPVAWHWSHVTVLPNGQAIGQLGEQVVLVDLDTERAAVLARGVFPAVVMEDASFWQFNSENLP